MDGFKRSKYSTRSTTGEKRKIIESSSDTSDENEDKDDGEDEDDEDDDYTPEEDKDEETEETEESEGTMEEDYIKSLVDKLFTSLAGDEGELSKCETNYHISPDEKKILDDIEKQLRKYYTDDVPTKIKILRLDAPMQIKAKLLHKWEFMESIGVHHSEYGKSKKWIDIMLIIPWGQTYKVPVTINDGYNKINKYLLDVQHHLNESIYGQNEPKMAMLEAFAQWIINPQSKGLIMGFQGPPGTGKTSFLLNGVVYALKRPFINIALGGSRDGCLLEGSSQVWEGSSCGKVVKSLIDAKCMNPIFYFDELDKLSNTPHGEEISNVLLHLIDNTQNHLFEDKYLEIPIDVSGAVFVFSYNNSSMINHILKDRIKEIKFNGYTLEDKLNIASKHTLHKLCKEWGFRRADLNISDDVIKYIINRYTDNEAGIRRLVHLLETIIGKLNLLRMMSKEYFNDVLKIQSEDVQGEIIKLSYTIPNLKFPLQITFEIVDSLINCKLNDKTSYRNMYL
jgi:ATP-dependent Lon protease